MIKINKWEYDHNYSEGDVVNFFGKLYRCAVPHQSGSQLSNILDYVSPFYIKIENLTIDSKTWQSRPLTYATIADDNTLNNQQCNIAVIPISLMFITHGTISSGSNNKTFTNLNYMMELCGMLKYEVEELSNFSNLYLIPNLICDNSHYLKQPWILL